MTIHGIDAGLGPLGLPRETTRGGRAEDAPKRAAIAVHPPVELLGRGVGADAREALEASEPPQGTDPALWSVLTPEERQFFAKARSTGPLMYGRGPAADPVPGARLGGRIDVRV